MQGSGNFFITDVKLENCVALQGGGLFTSGDGSTRFENSVIKSAGAYAWLPDPFLAGGSEWTPGGFGGGMYVSSKLVNHLNIQILHCSATYGGGGLAVRPPSSLVNADSNGKAIAFGQSGKLIGSNSIAVANLVSSSIGQKRLPLQTAVPAEPDNGRGGGVLLSGKEYSLSGIIFRNNSAAGGGGAGILAESRGDMDYCVFDENSAALVEGGGIYVQESAHTKLSNVTFNKNSALGAGALYVGVFTNKETVVFLNDAIFRNNKAVDGGALFILMAESLTLELENASFIENKATNGDGGSAAIVGNGNFTISNSEFIGNSASSGNGGHLKLEKCRLTIVNTTFIGSADSDARDAGCHLARGSSTAGTDVTSFCGPTGREYNSIYGGAIYLASPGTRVHATGLITTEHLSKFGGAFHVERSATFNLLNSVISRNEAAFGGAFEITQQSTVTIFDSVLSKNLATADGGCIHSEKSSILMERCSVTGNTAGSRGVVYLQISVLFYTLETQQLQKTEQMAKAVLCTLAKARSLYLEGRSI